MSQLYLIPTPIGNLEDITLRAIRLLKEVDLILAEDTRTSAKLLQHSSIDTPCKPYHMHNEHKVTDSILNELKNGRTIALITDAGTPGISDPGFLLVREALAANIPIQTLPGATAFVPALVNSGLPNHNFVFEGFLPVKKGRQTKLKELAEEKRTFILYESPYRMIKTLEQLAKFLDPDRPASVSRELTKKFEETQRGTLSELADYFKKNSPKGEFVIVVSGKG